jgi:hypothetical protein
MLYVAKKKTLMCYNQKVQKVLQNIVIVNEKKKKKILKKDFNVLQSKSAKGPSKYCHC